MSGPQPKQLELGYFGKKLLTHSERTLCECVVKHTSNIGDDTRWNDTWLCNTSKHRISEFGEHEVTECPSHANQEFILKRINDPKYSFEKFSMKSEISDGLSSCSNFPERLTETEIAANKPVLLQVKAPESQNIG